MPVVSVVHVKSVKPIHGTGGLGFPGVWALTCSTGNAQPFPTESTRKLWSFTVVLGQQLLCNYPQGADDHLNLQPLSFHRANDNQTRVSHIIDSEPLLKILQRKEARFNLQAQTFGLGLRVPNTDSRLSIVQHMSRVCTSRREPYFEVLISKYPEGPYTLLLWNQVRKDHPHYGFGDLIP